MFEAVAWQCFAYIHFHIECMPINYRNFMFMCMKILFGFVSDACPFIHSITHSLTHSYTDSFTLTFGATYLKIKYSIHCKRCILCYTALLLATVYSLHTRRYIGELNPIKRARAQLTKGNKKNRQRSILFQLGLTAKRCHCALHSFLICDNLWHTKPYFIFQFCAQLFSRYTHSIEGEQRIVLKHFTENKIANSFAARGVN